MDRVPALLKTKKRNDSVLYFKKFLDKLSSKPYRKVPYSVVLEIKEYMKCLEELPYLNYHSMHRLLKRLSLTKYTTDIPYLIIMCDDVSDDFLLNESEKTLMVENFRLLGDKKDRSTSVLVYAIAKYLNLPEEKLDFISRVIKIPLKYINNQPEIINESSLLIEEVSENESDSTSILESNMEPLFNSS